MKKNYLRLISCIFLTSALSLSFLSFACAKKSTSQKKSAAKNKGADNKDKIKCPKTGNPRIKIVTSMGHMHVDLDRKASKLTVDNFINNYVNSGYFANTIFHRVIKGFMIQGGGFISKDNGSISEKPTTAPPIKLEAYDNKLKNNYGTIAMARTNMPHSATSQFFLNHSKNDFLNATKKDNGYTVFGAIVESKTSNKIMKTGSFKTLEDISAVGVGQNGPHSNVPNSPVTIKDIYCIKQSK